MHNGRILALPISLALFTIVITGYGIQKPGDKEPLVLESKEPIEQSIALQILEENQISDEIAQIEAEPELVLEEALSEEVDEVAEEIAQVEAEPELVPEEAPSDEMEGSAGEVAQVEIEPELAPEEALSEEMEGSADEVAQAAVEPELAPEEALSEEMEGSADEVAQAEVEPELAPQDTQASDEVALNADVDGWVGPGKYSGIYFSSKQSYTAWRNKFHRYSRGKKAKHPHRRAVGIYKENK